MAAITPDAKQELVAVYLIMFGNAPSAAKLAEMVAARESGSTVFQVAATLSTETGFDQISAKDAGAFALYLTDALLADDTPASARAWATNWTVTQVQGTKTKAQVIAEAVQAIRATTNTNYTTAKAELAADVTSALENINNPPPPMIGAQLGQEGVSEQDFLAFLNANASQVPLVYAYANQLGLSFAELVKQVGANAETEEALRQSFVEHGLSAQALGAHQPARNGYPSTATALTTGMDNHRASTGADTLNALAGDDQVYGLEGSDLILGGEGNDLLDGGRGRDRLDGGAGNDILHAGTHLTADESSYLDSYSMTEVYSASYTFDDIHAEWLYGRAGNDFLYGGYGSDYLEGGEGNDVLEGDYNALYTAYASATQLASMMHDTLYGGAGADTLKGGEGNDTYLYQGMPGTPEVVAGETISDIKGTDTLWALTSTDFSLLGGGTSTLSSMGLEQVLITSSQIATFTAAQLTGTAIRINASGELPAQLLIQGAAGTYDFSQLQFAAWSGAHAFDSGTDRVTLDFSSVSTGMVFGTALNDTILVKGDSSVNAGPGDDAILYTPLNNTISLTLNGGSNGTDTLEIATETYTGVVRVSDAALGRLYQMEALSFTGGKAVEVTAGTAASASWTSGMVITQESNAALTVDGRSSLVPITAVGNGGNDLLAGGSAHDHFSGGLGADRFVFLATDVDSTVARVTDTVTDFRKSQNDTLHVGLTASATSFQKIGSHTKLSDLLATADQKLNGIVQILVGQVGNDTFVVTDADGKGYTQVIRLTGINLEDIAASDFVVA